MATKAHPGGADTAVAGRKGEEVGDCKGRVFIVSGQLLVTGRRGLAGVGEDEVWKNEMEGRKGGRA